MVKPKVAREGKEEKLQKACQKYGVPQSTLRYCFRGAHLPARKAHGDQQLLSKEKQAI
ncbi:hypothetical protein BDR03DRAFT_969882, partial [Suillus americanus]